MGEPLAGVKYFSTDPFIGIYPLKIVFSSYDFEMSPIHKKILNRFFVLL